MPIVLNNIVLKAVYYYLLDNPVSGPLFVPTVIAALHPSNRILVYYHWISIIDAGIYCKLQSTRLIHSDRYYGRCKYRVKL